jgi:hypothetical protein
MLQPIQRRVFMAVFNQELRRARSARSVPRMKTIPPGAMGSFMCGFFALILWWTPYVGLGLACISFFQAWRAQRNATLHTDLYSASYLPLFGVSMAALGFVGSLFITLLTLAISSVMSGAGQHTGFDVTAHAPAPLLW